MTERKRTWYVLNVQVVSLTIEGIADHIDKVIRSGYLKALELIRTRFFTSSNYDFQDYRFHLSTRRPRIYN